jgi:hypothetical protein
MEKKLVLEPAFVYGINPDTLQNIFFASNETIIYPAGGVLVVHNFEHQRQQLYIHLRNKQRPLNVICISPDKYTFDAKFCFWTHSLEISSRKFDEKYVSGSWLRAQRVVTNRPYHCTRH